MNVTIHPISRFSGKITVPGDKSISHRSLLFGALAEGKTEISGLLRSQDVYSTWKCLEALGVTIHDHGKTVEVLGVGMKGFKKPNTPLPCGNSGTTLRLLMGILTGFPFPVSLEGDESLSRRPMNRIAIPLRQMGAQIQLVENNFAPVRMQGSETLKAIQYELPVASAQLKSAVILAGLFAHGETVLIGKIFSRDHTENLLPHFGAKLTIDDHQIRIPGQQKFRSNQIQVPGDISSAAFWMGAALMIPGSVLGIENLSLNPSRIGIISVLKRMGARIETEVTSTHPEVVGKLRIAYSPLQGTLISSDEIPSLVDEIPLLAVLSTIAEGTTEIRGAEELRVKETDRIEAIAQNLRTLGVELETYPDGLSIRGPQTLQGGRVNSFHDHRIAMAFSIAALRSKAPIEILGSDCVGISYPGFYEQLALLTKSNA